MSCCGSQRMTVRSDAAAAPPDRTKVVRQTHIALRYVGLTGLTVVGMATGTRYRFDSAGAVVAIDIRDEISLRSVPYLRRVYSAGG